MEPNSQNQPQPQSEPVQQPQQDFSASPMPMQPTAPAAQVPAASVAQDDGPKSYLAMMVLAALAGPLGLARWYRGDKIGKIRFWIFVASFVLSFVVIGLVPLIVLYVWGIVDYFLLRKVRTDTQGRPLSLTQRDLKFEFWGFVYTIVSAVGAALYALIWIIFAGVIIASFTRAINGTSDSGSMNRSNDSSQSMNMYN